MSCAVYLRVFKNLFWVMAANAMSVIGMRRTKCIDGSHEALQTSKVGLFSARKPQVNDFELFIIAMFTYAKGRM